MGSNFDPYTYNKTYKTKIDKFAYGQNKKLARLTDATFAVNTALSSNMIEAAKKLRDAPNVSNGVESGVKSDLNPNEKLPWNIDLSYNLSLNNPDDTKLHPTHSMRLKADIMPTKYWKLGITTGYDFTTQKMSTTRLTIYRDLKCWEAHIDWVPFGAWKSYNITLNLKTSMLSELKLPWPHQPVIQ